MSERPFLQNRIIAIVFVATSVLLLSAGCTGLLKSQDDSLGLPCTEEGSTAICGAGFVCLNQVCSIQTDKGPDREEDASNDSNPPDAPVDTGPKLGQVSDACMNDDTKCSSGLSCMPANIFLPATNFATESFCSKTCCSSEDCPQNSVCMPSSTYARSFCVSASKVSGRSVPEIGGAAASVCSKNSDCRSGLCSAGSVADKAGFCLDTCCPNKVLANGAKCGYFIVSASSSRSINGFQESGSFSYNPSAQPVVKDEGSLNCTTSNTAPCASGLCISQSVGSICKPLCCNACGANQTCTLITDSNKTLRVYGCYPIGATAIAPRNLCTSDSACGSGECDIPLGKVEGTCTEPCCMDSDCTFKPAGKCKLFAKGLRCVYP